jgi:toxin YoeB
MPYRPKLLPDAKKDCLYWQKNNPAYAKKIKALLADMMEDPFRGLGRPEPLKHNLHGFWSRQISEEHRILYEVKEDVVYVYRCYGHYG